MCFYLFEKQIKYQLFVLKQMVKMRDDLIESNKKSLQIDFAGFDLIGTKFTL